jgi:hypothetical protein
VFPSFNEAFAGVRAGELQGEVVHVGRQLHEGGGVGVHFTYFRKLETSRLTWVGTVNSAFADAVGTADFNLSCNVVATPVRAAHAPLLKDVVLHRLHDLDVEKDWEDEIITLQLIWARKPSLKKCGSGL